MKNIFCMLGFHKNVRKLQLIPSVKFTCNYVNGIVGMKQCAFPLKETWKECSRCGKVSEYKRREIPVVIPGKI